MRLNLLDVGKDSDMDLLFDVMAPYKCSDLSIIIDDEKSKYVTLSL